MKLHRIVLWLLGGFGGLASAVGAMAQTYPSRPITVVIPFPPGGGTDTVARVMQDSMAADLGQPIVIENKAGAAGSTALGGVARSAPDGYTLVLTNNPALTQNLHLQKSIPYDAATAFAPISLVADSNTFLVVNAKVPASTVSELIAFARSSPRPLSYGSAGPGSTYHIAGELLRSAAKVDISHVPYRGTAALVQDLVAGQIEIGWGTPTAVMPFVETKALRLLGTAEARRSAAFPGLPALAETLPDLVTSTWTGMLAPAGTPKAIVDRLNASVRKTLQDPKIIAALKVQGWFVKSSTPEEMGARMTQEREHWGKVLPGLGLRPQ